MPDTGSAASRINQLDRLRLRHLRLLALVAERGSLSAAAAALHLSQPAATNMLRDLESAFAAPLIVRSAAGSTLTAAGRVALERLRLALSAVQKAVDSVAQVPADPVIHIGMIPAVGVRTLPRLVQALAAKGRLPRLVVHEATVPALVHMLAQGKIDCLIGRLDMDVEANPEMGELVVETLGPEQLGIACAIGHPLSRQDSVTLQDLRAAQWAVAPHGARTRQFFEQCFHDAGLTAPAPRIESFSFHTNLCMVAETELLTIAPASAIAHYAGLGRVHALALKQPFPVSRQLFVRLRDSPLPALDDIAAALRDISAA